MATTALVGLDGPLAGRRIDLGQGYSCFAVFLALSRVYGARGHAGDEWFVDLAV